MRVGDVTQVEGVMRVGGVTRVEAGTRVEAVMQAVGDRERCPQDALAHCPDARVRGTDAAWAAAGACVRPGGGTSNHGGRRTGDCGNTDPSTCLC